MSAGDSTVHILVAEYTTVKEETEGVEVSTGDSTVHIPVAHYS